MNPGISPTAIRLWVEALRAGGYEPLDDFYNAVLDSTLGGGSLEYVKQAIATENWMLLEGLLEQPLGYGLEGMHIHGATLIWDEWLGGFSQSVDLWVKWGIRTQL